MENLEVKTMSVSQRTQYSLGAYSAKPLYHAIVN